MNTSIDISNLTNYINQIDKIARPEISYLYRGQENEAWRVTSSAYRRLEKQVDVDPDLLDDLFVGYVKQIVDEAQLKYPSTYRDLFPLECMAHLQHNKVSTGLIDFTLSPLVALWFACANREDANGKVLVLENDSGRIEEIKTTEKLEQELDTFFHVDQAQWHLWSPTLDSRAVDTERMNMQQSVFLFGLPEVDTKMIAREIIIRSDAKENIRTALKKMGISEETLFSDLLGFFERNTYAQPYDQTLAQPYHGGISDGK